MSIDKRASGKGGPTNMKWSDVVSTSEILVKKTEEYFLAFKANRFRRIQSIKKDIPAAWSFVTKRTQQIFAKIQKFFHNVYSTYIVRGEYSTRSLVVIGIIAILFGIVLKILSANTFTIGFQDYTLAPAEKIIDLNVVQHRLLLEGGSLATPENSIVGPACSQ